MNTLVVIGSVLTSSTLLAQERGPIVPADVRAAQQLLTAAYPELRTGRHEWRMAPTDDGATLEAMPAVAPFELPASTPQVAAMVRLDEEGRLSSLRISGTLVRSARQKVATISARTPTALAEALRAAGAKFIPGDPNSTEGLLAAGVTQALGVAERQATFRSERSAAGADDALTWAVEVETGEAVPRRYALVFEPVEGRLLSVVRR